MVLLPPRGAMDTPQYYAYGADIPRALDAVAAVRRSSDTLDQELDAQLVGLARLVTDPAGRSPVEGRPRITLASDLHNNVITLPILERAAGDGPVFFAGDLSDRGSPLESSLTNQVAHLGSKFVFVTGNHDSDQSAQELADDGAIVLTQDGRLLRNGRHGAVINEIAGMRVAGYSDPFERKAADDFADHYEEPTEEQQTAFADWLRPLIGRVDVVMVHEPALIAQTLDRAQADPADQPARLPRRPHAHRGAHTTAERRRHQRRLDRRRRDRQPRGRDDRRRPRADELRRRPRLRAARRRPRLDRPGHRRGDRATRASG